MFLGDFLTDDTELNPLKIHVKIVCLDSKKILTKSIYTKMFFYYCFGFTFHFYFYIIFGI